jgi:hypothetical protein
MIFASAPVRASLTWPHRPCPRPPCAPQGWFLSALRAFKTRTAYANASGDHLVGWANSSVRGLEDLPEVQAR